MKLYTQHPSRRLSGHWLISSRMTHAREGESLSKSGNILEKYATPEELANGADIADVLIRWILERKSTVAPQAPEPPPAELYADNPVMQEVMQYISPRVLAGSRRPHPGPGFGIGRGDEAHTKRLIGYSCIRESDELSGSLLCFNTTLKTRQTLSKEC